MRELDAFANSASEEEIFMKAAENAISSVLVQADDDSAYHHDPKHCKEEMLNKKLNTDPNEIAESIIGWTLVL